MDDSISGAAVLEIIREYCPDEPISKDLREYWKKRFEPLIKVREEVEKIPLADRWIPCKERLPKKVGDYLVTTHGGQIARYIYMGNGSSKEYWLRCALAWMPLPEPYHPEGDGDNVHKPD